MLGIVEKVQYGVSGLVFLVAVGFYITWPPEERHPDLVPKITFTTKTRPSPRPPPRAGSGQRTTPPRASVSSGDAQLLARLAKHGVRGLNGKTVEHKLAVIPRETFEFFQREANLIPELNKAQSNALAGADGKKTRLQIFGIQEDCYLKTQFGLEDGDIVEFIDDQQIDFDAGMLELKNRYQKLMAKLESGGSVTITLTRAGRPVQFEFKL